MKNYHQIGFQADGISYIFNIASEFQKSKLIEYGFFDRNGIWLLKEKDIGTIEQLLEFEDNFESEKSNILFSSGLNFSRWNIIWNAIVRKNARTDLKRIQNQYDQNLKILSGQYPETGDLKLFRISGLGGHISFRYVKESDQSCKSLRYFIPCFRKTLKNVQYIRNHGTACSKCGFQDNISYFVEDKKGKMFYLCGKCCPEQIKEPLL